jgi:hypothetical protein
MRPVRSLKFALCPNRVIYPIIEMKIERWTQQCKQEDGI